MKHISVEDYYSLSLNEINDITDPALKKEILILYNENIRKIEKDSIGKYFIEPNKSIEEILFDIDQYTNSITSEYLFDNNIIKFYPNIKEVIASKPITCHFSGGIIKKGSLYCYYRPFLHNIDTNQKFVLKKSIKVEESYKTYLPTNIKEFERFIYNLDNAYTLDSNDDLDFYLINCNLGDWSLLELKNKSKTKVLK